MEKGIPEGDLFGHPHDAWQLLADDRQADAPEVTGNNGIGYVLDEVATTKVANSHLKQAGKK